MLPGTVAMAGRMAAMISVSGLAPASSEDQKAISSQSAAAMLYL
jgi:hypothetical protein